MDAQNKSKEELKVELQELQKAYNTLKVSAEADRIGHKQSMEALQEREENLSTTLQSIGDGVISTDKNGLVIHMNPVAETLCGWKLSDAFGKPLSEVFTIINAESRQIVADPVKEVLEKGEIVGLANHTVLVSRNGTEYQISDSAAPIKNKEGAITGVVLVFSDITESYIAQKQIKESEERYRSLLNNLEAGIVVHAPDTSIVMNNPRASDLLGLSDDQMRGKAAIDPAWKFVDEENNPLSLDQYPVNRIINSRQPIKNQVLGSQQPDKDAIVWVTVNGFPVLDNTGEITEIVISFIDITERKQSERLLQEKSEEIEVQNEELNQTNQRLAEAKEIAEKNEARMKMAMKVSKSGAWDWDIVKNSFYWSDEFLQLFGLPENTIAGFAAWTKALHSEDIERASLKIIEAIENHTELLSDYRIILSNNEIRWIRATGTVTYLNHKPQRMIGLCMDLTFQKTAEYELYLAKERAEESERLLARIAENYPNSFVSVIEKDLTVGFSGGQEFKRLNLNPNDFKGLTLDQVFGEFSGIVRENYLSTFSGNETSFELFINNQYQLYKTVPLVDEHNQITRILSVVENITERKHLEKIREIQYNIATAVVTSDSVSQLLEFVRTQLSQLFDTTNFFAALFNAQNNTLKKLHWVDEVDDFEEWDASISFSGYVVKTGKMLLLNKQEIAKLGVEQNIPIMGAPAECWLGVPLVVDKKNIGVIVIQSYSDPRAYDASSARLFEQVAYDLSVYIEKSRILQDLNIAKLHAEESDRLKSAFLANMSHEIRTPMNGILGFAEILKDPELTGEQQREYIKIIEKSGNRMLNIINDIIDISKIESGLIKLDIKESNINDQIEYIYTFFKPEVEAKGMKLLFKTTLPAKEATIKTDREKVYAILTNLVKNAIKYTPAGTIEFGYNHVETFHGTSLQFFVKDTGIGIPAHRQEAIFERFIQADISDKMARQGAGLGLAITKSYVEMLGGNIWVESQEDFGSTFYFTLPYNARPDEKATVKTSVFADGTTNLTRPIKILIAEDDEASEMLISLMVNVFCKEILKVRTGLEAVETSRENPDIDLILMDIQMPVMGGYEAIRQIREFNKNVIIIAQTAYGLSGDREKAIEAGCNDYIAKPINKAELQTLILKYLGY
ncbi:MAG: PAS domain S-box protein [Mariniphaga sp.]